VRFWKQRPHDDALEHDLRSGRPEPSSEFVRSVSARVRRRGRPQLAWRLGLAFTAALAIALASIGGVAQGTHAIGRVVGLSQASSSHALKQQKPAKADPAKDQYKEARKVCKKTEKTRHKNSQQLEEQTHKANMEAIKLLPKNQQKAAREAEEARHRSAEQAEHELHQQNQRTCHEIGK
jgi:hypothetical protein